MRIDGHGFVKKAWRKGAERQALGKANARMSLPKTERPADLSAATFADAFCRARLETQRLGRSNAGREGRTWRED